MDGGLESRCVGHVYGADGAVHGTIRTVHMLIIWRILFPKKKNVLRQFLM
jgi:hypothetical protein